MLPPTLVQFHYCKWTNQGYATDFTSIEQKVTNAPWFCIYVWWMCVEAKAACQSEDPLKREEEIILWWIKKKYETFHVLPAALLWWYFMVCCVWSIFASSDPLEKKLTIIGWNPPGLLFWWASSQFHDFYLLGNMNHSWQMIFLFDVIHNQFERIDFQRAEGYLFTSPFVVEVSHFMLLFSSMLNRPWQPFVMG